MATAPKVIVKKVNVGKKKKRRRAGGTIPLSIVGGLLPGLHYTVAGWRSGSSLTDSLEKGMAHLSVAFTGYDPVAHKWQLANMSRGLTPLLAGILVHKVAGKLGVNRVLSSARVPWIRI